MDNQEQMPSNNESAPWQIKCGISGKIMLDPVVAEDGYSYERANIEKWFEKTNKSPKTKEEMGATLINNKALASYIKESWMTNKTVLIIGGGKAAVKLAHSLSNAGINFQIVEWNEYLGGRIHHIDFQGTIVEEGANWVTGT